MLVWGILSPLLELALVWNYKYHLRVKVDLLIATTQSDSQEETRGL
jgi:hypothetical protein